MASVCLQQDGKVWEVREQDLPKVVQGLKNLPPETLLGEPVTTADKVAFRHWHKEAAFFSVGDIILYGKYKNKRGKVVRFSKNNKDQPVVEIEPIPKGRKKNKTMGLFKIWNATKAEEAKVKIDAEKAKEKEEEKL